MQDPETQEEEAQWERERRGDYSEPETLLAVVVSTTQTSLLQTMKMRMILSTTSLNWSTPDLSPSERRVFLYPKIERIVSLFSCSI